MIDLILEKLLKLLYNTFLDWIVKKRMEGKLKADIEKRLRSIENEKDPHARARRMRDFLS